MMAGPTPRRVVLDTNIYIDWLNEGLHEPLVLGPGLARYLAAPVLMELRAGAGTSSARRAVDQLARAYEKAGRLVAPSAGRFDEAGSVLRRLKDAGREIRRGSLAIDVLVAVSARAVGATVCTRDADFEAIRAALEFGLELVR